MLLRVSFVVLSFIFALRADTLDQLVKARVTGFAGKVSAFAKNLATGETYSLYGDQPVRTASTIKLPIMIECYAEASAGKLQFSEPIRVTAEEKVKGSGILQDLSDGTQLQLQDMVLLMIALSDNTATNLVLNRIGGNAVNARMADLGLKYTRVMRKIIKSTPQGVTDEGAKPENAQWGLGRSSAQEMVTLLEKLYRGELVNKQASAAMIEVLKKQRDHNGIGRDLKDMVIANKSGALDALRSDVGIVYTETGAIAMAITVDGMASPDWSADNPGELMIAHLSALIIDHLQKR